MAARVDDALGGTRLGTHMRTWSEVVPRGATRVYRLHYEGE
ncbi:MAG: hypothetical protein ACYC6Y_27305 [Thermoguttaceae bacterium]